MSNNWDLKCITCNEFAYMDANHGGEYLAELWEKRKEIASLARIKINSIDITAEGGRGPLRIAFFLAHEDHDVQPWSEYGHALKSCWKRVECGSCHHFGRCSLDRDHAGECATLEQVKEKREQDRSLAEAKHNAMTFRARAYELEVEKAGLLATQEELLRQLRESGKERARWEHAAGMLRDECKALAARIDDSLPK